MAREGITYEQVKAAAEELVGEGREPSIRAVRERLRGTGSPNTIHRHLTKWRDSRPDAPAATTDLPASILREINGEIQRAASAARAEVEAQLAQAMTEAADLAASGEALEAERDALAEQVAALTSERDVLAGKAAEQRTLLDQQAKDLRAEQQSRIAAEKELAAVSAARDGLAERLKELQGREQTALREVTELRARADTSADVARTAAGDVARLQEALSRVTDEAVRLRSETLDLRSQLNAYSVENANLSGLLGREAPLAAPAPTRTTKKGS